MAKISNLNHAVLFVSDLARSVQFYEKAFGFEVVDKLGDNAAFLRAAGGPNHHDLGLFRARGGEVTQGNVGLYHLAWEVETIEDLAEAATSLGELGALTGMSDHGVSKSLYGADPDGIEFEVMYRVPREAWGDYERRAVTMPLDLQQEIQRFGGRKAAAGP
jgi:catechol-2,3-dioxygenase